MLENRIQGLKNRAVNFIIGVLTQKLLFKHKRRENIQRPRKRLPHFLILLQPSQIKLRYRLEVARLRKHNIRNQRRQKQIVQANHRSKLHSRHSRILSEMHNFNE